MPPSVKFKQHGHWKLPFLPFGYTGSSRLQNSAKLSNGPEMGSLGMLDTLQDLLPQVFQPGHYDFSLDRAQRRFERVHIHLTKLFGLLLVHASNHLPPSSIMPCL